jgi:hypothetical protein
MVERISLGGKDSRLACGVEDAHPDTFSAKVDACHIGSWHSYAPSRRTTRIGFRRD